MAHTAFESSANYRSATIRGTVTPLDREATDRVMQKLTEHLIPGRTNEVPANTTKELAATIAMLLPIESDNWLYKTRTGPSGEPDEPTSAWVGVVPMQMTAGEPVADAWVPADREVPASVDRLILQNPPA